MNFPPPVAHIRSTLLGHQPSGGTLAVYCGALVGNELAWGQPVCVVPQINEIEDAIQYDAPQIASDPVRGHVYLSCTRTDETAVETYLYDQVRSIDRWRSNVELAA